MSVWIRSHLRWVLVGGAAVFLFVAGGTAYAAFVVNSNADVAPDTIAGHAPPSGDQSNIIAASVANTDLAADSVRSPNIVNGAVANADLASHSVISTKIADGAVGNAALGTDSVDGGKILNSTISYKDVQLGGLVPGDISGVHAMAGSNPVFVDDPAGGTATNAKLLLIDGFTLTGHCTDAGGGSVTAQATVGFDNLTRFAAGSNAPGGTTDANAINPVTIGGFGPTTILHLGTGTLTVLAINHALVSGVLTVGTHVLGHDCVFAVNTLG